MKLARYWTRAQAEATSSRGKRVVAAARGWSNDSIDAARQKALEIAQRVAECIAAGPTPRKRYPYGERPLPEPVIREFAGGADAAAVVTRNAYGSLILNAERFMFVDVDRNDRETASGGLSKMMSSLFAKHKPSASVASDSIIESIGKVVEHRGLSARVYQTKGGYRVLITNASFVAGSDEAEALLGEFDADPLYRRLCRLQECFRARLTPKPWRCRMTDPPVSFPFETQASQERFDRWQANYDAKQASFATCAFIAAIGNGSVLPSFDELIRFHDEQTKATTSLALA